MIKKAVTFLLLFYFTAGQCCNQLHWGGGGGRATFRTILASEIWGMGYIYNRRGVNVQNSTVNCDLNIHNIIMCI